ncbi:hypothetical protein CEUSTIGMA_g10819.t1 [Chlamydomonas eustigma]|uniref:AB hydrolase-1 domain-containing protein n=1 Tax=Chlamydomonas eustigma TaxID=1157962 RepID=A0A250XJZ5_9CHLO|nr:hypothetical protein CEUSTIGMA_g10819.t1 [Chlamydomonas eustigma]|eukprot:GAX83394.1 hypothetical protein CEUSTIGMA_g10819.t1 [Chlamydomonas eustigma]
MLTRSFKAGPSHHSLEVSCRQSRRARSQSCFASADIVVEDRRHVTADGQGLELLLARQNEDSGNPPILFIHGSYHGAWCWREKFLPYFASKGYNSYALSLRGQGRSDIVVDQLVAGTLDTHAQDIADLVAMFPRPPVVIAHSFGGLILQKYLLGVHNSRGVELPPLAGAAFLSSVPPSGNKNLVWRFLRKDLLLSLRVTYGFIAKTFTKDANACRELFFSRDLPETDLLRYQNELSKCSPVRLMDLQDVNKQVPLSKPEGELPPIFVLGGKNDVVVDEEAIQETAKQFAVDPIIVDDVAHDCMLDTRWEEVARRLENWLQNIP